MTMEVQDPSATVATVGAELSTIEQQLIELAREGSSGGRPLDQIIGELSALAKRMRPHYSRLQETLERRDLTYELMAGLERSLRDLLYRQILEVYDEFSTMEETESNLRGMPDDLLAAELLQEDAKASGE
jgi:hypothetical protein